VSAGVWYKFVIVPAFQSPKTLQVRSRSLSTQLMSTAWVIRSVH